jgi:serine/threonine protein kinase/tetratricopeptide (TPR) repeat protein
MDLDTRNGLALLSGMDGPEESPSDEFRTVPSPADPDPEDPRLVRALEEYLSACERGRPPIRSQFLDEHFEIASRLEQCLDSLDRLSDAAVHFAPALLEETGPFISAAEDASLPARLGDYMLIREIGRGGMGIVYEAEQSSLSRRVALKLLPFTAAIDPKQVQRFQVEVQAAAHLHHPHIVPIHAVGRESGVHYYVMQLISGRSLAAMIRELQAKGRPSRSAEFFREVAALGIQAAEALEHAHSLGVVHRDVKPANLLVDDRQHLWVADFGLARLQGESGLTVSGDLLGTLRYMSPEQALARHGLVDHRTDIYSLGATLYELLTLQPAFQGSDLQSLLQRITCEEPIQPGRLNSSIPRDLETIVLKAVSKEPDSRYPTAQEMADDLRRFLDDRPIIARRPSWSERAGRWIRRHRAMAISAGVAVILGLVSLSISTLVIWNAMRQIAHEASARELELRRAESYVELAHQALDHYLDTAELWFPRDSAGDLLDANSLKTALTFYEQIASQNWTNPRVKLRTFNAYCRVGDIRATLGDVAGADDAYHRAMFTMVSLIEADPANDRNREALARVLEKFADLMRKQSVYGPAEWSFDEAIRQLEQVALRRPGEPEIRLALAHVLNMRASLKGETGHIGPALDQSRRALDLLKRIDQDERSSRLDPLLVRKELATAYYSVGKWLQLDGKFAEAEEVDRKALSLLEQLQREAHGTPAARESVAMSQAMLGDLLRSTGRHEEAEALFTQAIGGLERLATDFPRVPRYRKLLARYHIVLSMIFAATERPEESAAARQKAAKYDPRLVLGQQVHLNNLAWYLVTAANPDSRSPARGIELASRAVELAPDSWASWNTLGVARYRNGQFQAAREALEKSLQLARAETAYDGFFIAMTLWQLGDPESAAQWLERAERWRLINRPDDVELLRFQAEAEALLGTHPSQSSGDPLHLPGSVAEALRDPAFGLPPLCIPTQCTSTSVTAEQPPQNPGATPEKCKSSDALFEISEILDSSLFFMDMT